MQWLPSTLAAFAYFLGVFVVAFCLGTIRTLIVAPRVGATIAVLLETPIILTVSWWMSRWCIQRFNVGSGTADRALMGAIAFIVLILAEFTLSVVLFHRSPADYAATFASIPGALGLLAQVCFAAIPLAQAHLPPSRSPSAAQR
jgi:hypothetical protein